MIRKRTWRSAAAAVALSALMLAGCTKAADDGGKTTAPDGSSNPQAETKKTPEPVTLQFYFPGDPPNDQQAVLDEFYNRTKDTLNIKLSFNWVPWDQLKEKIGLKLASGEQVDAVFDAQWNTMPQMIAKGTFIQLDSYFNNDKYPGLKKAFPPAYINNNKFVDGKKEEHIYGVPFTKNYGSLASVAIRKDLRIKYGLPEIKSLAELEAYFDAVLQNEKGMIPFGVDGSLSSLGNWLQPDVKPTDFNAIMAGDLIPHFNIKDGKVDVVFAGEDISVLPAPLNTKEAFYLQEMTARRWYTKGYLEKDVISQKDAAGFFKAGKFAAIGADTAGFNAVFRELKKAVPGAEAELVDLVPGAKDRKPGAIRTDFKAWNFSSIPATSKNADRVMAFFDWLFADPKNHDLFEFGIEGKHWVPVGSDKFKLPDGVDPSKTYNFPGYVLTWNPSYVRNPDDWPEAVQAREKYLSDEKSYVKSTIAGFTLNAEPIKSELAKVGPEFKKVRTIASLGLADNYEALYKEAIDKMKKMGLEKIREEIKKQLEAFLAAQNK
ncbi:extracellular solute-binding protein [Paenibacillus flagellatus]|uniref:ABC transporter substrate-binding protein n=1 Tax=Paenibacillus flagellatus TaxID=2211139 RepID=A0A2V5K616_9BACL|nr:extracellular solute-binding protein [Paenibacillus flagellatus]PYI53344.1 ABC transporter substrate-binding protein [Paenibacillus flagellatus]